MVLPMHFPLRSDQIVLDYEGTGMCVTIKNVLGVFAAAGLKPEEGMHPHSLLSYCRFIVCDVIRCFSPTTFLWRGRPTNRRSAKWNIGRRWSMLLFHVDALRAVWLKIPQPTEEVGFFSKSCSHCDSHRCDVSLLHSLVVYHRNHAHAPHGDLQGKASNNTIACHLNATAAVNADHGM